MPVLLEELGLDDWRVDLRLERLDEACGQNRVNASEMHSSITIDPARHDEKDELRTTALHEALHLYHAEIDMAFDAALRAIPEGPTVDVLEQVFDFACERLVARLIAVLAPRLRKVAEVN
jgi:hypothetical protein